jgi:hypothetical protein
VYSVFVVIIFVDLSRLLTSGIRALSLVDIVGKYFFIFVVFFSEKKYGLRHSKNFRHIYVNIL